jgi:hypothetical protein
MVGALRRVISFMSMHAMHASVKGVSVIFVPHNCYSYSKPKLPRRPYHGASEMLPGKWGQGSPTGPPGASALAMADKALGWRVQRVSAVKQRPNASLTPSKQAFNMLRTTLGICVRSSKNLLSPPYLFPLP